jgi:hypothetical protein
MYNVSLQGVHVAIVAVERQQVLHIMRTYLQRMRHIVIRGLSGYTIFFHIV